MEEGKKLKISYKNLEEFDVTPVINGIFGGISPDGLLTLNLYFDRKSMPTSLEIEHIEHHLFGNERPCWPSITALESPRGSEDHRRREEKRVILFRPKETGGIFQAVHGLLEKRPWTGKVQPHVSRPFFAEV